MAGRPEQSPYPTNSRSHWPQRDFDRGASERSLRESGVARGLSQVSRLGLNSIFSGVNPGRVDRRRIQRSRGKSD